MTIIYVHGVKVRSPEHGIRLRRPFERWLGPKLTVNGALPGYEPVYWGDLGATFGWNLASRPRTTLLHQGGDEDFAGLGSLRGVGSDTPFDKRPSAPVQPGPVLGGPYSATPSPTAPLSSVARDRRADFLADLYLACRPIKDAKDPIIEEPEISALADAAAVVAERWDEITAAEPNDNARAQKLIATVDAVLKGDDLIAQGGFADWITRAGEIVRRAGAWPGDALSTVLGEARPFMNEFVVYFVGDVFTYLTRRGDRDVPGEIPRRMLAALLRAQTRKKVTGEKIVIVSHSMGGQLIYDALAHFADADPQLDGLEVDHWISCGSQVSFFAEMRLLLGQPDPAGGQKLAMPRRLKAWTNFYDTNDLVGFIMAPVFEGVKDLPYDTGYGLVFAHTGFLARPSFFEAIAARL